MKIINGSFVNMLDELENFQQLSSSLDHGWIEKYENKQDKRELGREREKKARRNPKNCVRKSVFSYKSIKNKREKKKNKGT
jgi:hypothetical protein